MIEKKKTTKKHSQVGTSMALGAIAGIVAACLAIGGAFLWLSHNTDIFSLDNVEQETVTIEEEESSTISVVEKVSPAVVSVVVKAPASSVDNGVISIEDFFSITPREDEKSEDGEDEELVEVGAGTAFFVTSDGLLLTNKHVVVGDDIVTSITTQDGTEYAVEIAAVDTLYDIAVLRVTDSAPEGGFPTVTLAESDDLKTGQTVIAIGNALSEFSNTVTKGIVSGMNREIVAGSASGSELIRQAIQTDAAINPGNSGGPLINLSGEVVGINTAISNRGSNLGFAIPISVGKKAIDDVKTFGRIVRPWLGIRYVMLTSENVEKYKFSALQRGAYILTEDEAKAPGVIEDSPASKAGLKEGDIIISIGGKQLTEDDDLAMILNTYHPGDQIQLRIVRELDMITDVTVELGEFDESALEE